MDEMQQRAMERMSMRGVDESRMAFEGQTNAGGGRKTYSNGAAYYDPAPLTEYPRMMYRKSGPERVQQTDEHAKCGETFAVVNNYGTPAAPLHCDTMVAHDATEAEALTEAGWDISPRAAHGLSDGLAKQTSAKDEEIARLKAQLAERDVAEAQPERRGPGRPPKLQQTA